MRASSVRLRSGHRPSAMTRLETSGLERREDGCDGRSAADDARLLEQQSGGAGRIGGDA